MWQVTRRAALLLGLAVAPTGAQQQPATAYVQVCFTPPAGRCADEIARSIDGAERQVLVQEYEFTNRKVIGALARAKARGVDVRVILDKVVAHYPAGASSLVALGVPVWIDRAVTIAHNKVIIIDGETVIGGSFNLSYAADTRNAENVTWISSPGIASEFTANWVRRLAVSTQWK